MKPTLLIKNARIFSSVQDFTADVLVENGKIKKIGSITAGADEVIDAKGLMLMYGAFDPQVHFRDPGFPLKEDLASGSRAAVAGGVTSYLDMPNTKPATITAERLETKRAEARKKSMANFGFFIGATPDNQEEISLVRGVPGIKIFMGSSTGNLLVDKKEDLEKHFASARHLIAVHAEDESIMKAAAVWKTTGKFEDHVRARPAAAAYEASKLAVELAKKYRKRLHILHVGTLDECELLSREKNDLITAETLPQYLTLSAPECYKLLGSRAQMNPPIREAEHTAALLNALKSGVIDIIATDHAPHTLKEKSLPYGRAPAGMPGVETSLPVMLDLAAKAVVTYAQVSRWMCEKPYEIYNVIGKGRIEEGYDADLILIDTALSRTVEDGELITRVNWSPFAGRTLTGWPVITFVGGEIAYREGDFSENVRGEELKFKSWNL